MILSFAKNAPTHFLFHPKVRNQSYSTDVWGYICYLRFVAKCFLFLSRSLSKTKILLWRLYYITRNNRGNLLNLNHWILCTPLRSYHFLYNTSFVYCLLVNDILFLSSRYGIAYMIQWFCN